MRLFILSLLIVCAGIFPALAQDNHLTIDLAQRSVNITMGFSGANLSLFGVKDQPGDIAIIIKGPERRIVVRRKDQVAGIWMNRESVAFRNVPVYYDLALSKPERDMAATDLLQEHGIGLDALNFHALGHDKPETVRTFREALIRNKQIEGYFPLEPKNILFLNDNFFRANFYMPANVPNGEYDIVTYLFKDGALVSKDDTKLRVGQVGFSARMFRFAYLHGIAYGLVAVMLALLSGGAGWAFLRRE